MKNKIGKWLRSIPIYEVYKDLSNYGDWIKTIKREKNNPKSKFHLFKMDHNLFYMVYLPVTLPEEDEKLPDKIKRLRIVEILRPVHLYLDEELGFSEYIIPEFSQFIDDDGNPTLTYGVIYRFGFKKLSLNWIIKRTIFWGAAIFLFFYFDVKSIILETLSNL